MHDPRGPGRKEGERSPIRRLSSMGGVTTGWRSSLETNPHQSLGSFVIGSLIAGGAFIAIAEGVETDAERQTLAGLGVELGQGYLFGRPGPMGAGPHKL